MVQNRREPIFVQPWEHLGSFLDTMDENTALISQILAYEEATLKVALEFLDDEAGLFPARNIGHAPF